MEKDLTHNSHFSGKSRGKKRNKLKSMPRSYKEKPKPENTIPYLQEFRFLSVEQDLEERS
jgi:hypothetical protein